MLEAQTAACGAGKTRSRGAREAPSGCSVLTPAGVTSAELAAAAQPCTSDEEAGMLF